MRACELAKLINRTPSAISLSLKKQRIIKQFNLFLFTEKPSYKEKRVIQSMLKLDDEVWVTIEGSDNLFFISNYGRVKVKTPKGFIYRLNNANSTRELQVCCRFQNVEKSYPVKTIVAHHFLEKGNPGEFLCHLNGDVKDNFSSNLKWVNKEKFYKQLKKVRHKSKAVVKLDASSGLILDEYRSIKETTLKNPYCRQIMREFLSGERKNEEGYIFMFEEEYIAKEYA